MWPFSRKPAQQPVEAPKKLPTEEYEKLYNLFIENSGKYSLLKAELEALILEVDNLKVKFKYTRLKPDETKNDQSLPKALNTFNPFG